MAEFSFTYRAFISYAHADHKWGVWLHQALERYRVPRRLAGVENLRRLGKMFRDEEELAVAAELGPKIDAALKASDVLVVVCSPRSAKSKWVNQEIDAFKKLGREHRVFALIVDGTPHGANDECFPEALKHNLAGGPTEPLAADVRKFGREDAALRLIAGILDVGYDDLRQREVGRRRADMLRAQALFASGIMLVALALTGGYFAASNYVGASEEKSKLFAREAGTLFTEGQFAKAMLVSLYGDPAAEAGVAEQLLRPEGYPAARNALVRALEHNRLQRTIHAGSSVDSVAFAPDGGMILTGFNDGTAKLWPAEGGEALAVFKAGKNPVSSVAFSPDGTKVLTGCIDGTTKLWRLEGGDAIATFVAPPNPNWRHTSSSSAAFSPDGTRLSIGYNNGMVKLWPVQGGEALATFQASENPVASIAFSPDGKSVLVGVEDLSVHLWPAEGGAAIATFKGHVGAVRSVAFSPDGRTVLIGAEDGTAKLWSVRGGEPLNTFEGHKGGVAAVAFSPDGALVLTGSSDGKVRLWRTESDNVLATFVGHEDYVTSVKFSPDGKRLLTGSGDGTAKVWLAGGPEPRAMLSGHEAMVTSVAFSPDGKRILSGSRDGTARLWQAEDGAALATSKRLGGAINSVAFSPDGKNVLTGSDDGTAMLWPLKNEIGSGKALADFQVEWVVSVAFSSSGAEALIVTYERVELRPADGSREVTTITNGAISAAISPDGKTVLTGSQGGKGELWPATGGAAIATFVGHKGQVRSVAFSPNGKSVLTGSVDGTAKVWRQGGGDAIATFVAHKVELFGDPSIESVAFSPDGRFVLTGSSNGLTELWPAEGGDVLETFRLDGSDVTSVAFSPNGATVLTGSSDKTARLWPINPILLATPAEQVRLACTRLKEIGVTALSEADLIRFPIVDRHAPHPCANVWAGSLRKNPDTQSARIMSQQQPPCPSENNGACDVPGLCLECTARSGCRDLVQETLLLRDRPPEVLPYSRAELIQAH